MPAMFIPFVVVFFPCFIDAPQGGGIWSSGKCAQWPNYSHFRTQNCSWFIVGPTSGSWFTVVFVVQAAVFGFCCWCRCCSTGQRNRQELVTESCMYSQNTAKRCKNCAAKRTVVQTRMCSSLDCEHFPVNLACIPRLYTSPVYLACIPLLYTSPVYLSCIPLLYTSPVYLSCIPLLYTSPVYLSCIPLLYTSPAYLAIPANYMLVFQLTSRRKLVLPGQFPRV